MPTLTWLTRDNDLKLSQIAPYRLLEHAPDLSYGDAETDSMLIHGDNLDALKALLPYFAGTVKCVCIDPPYNTRNAFEHYDDNLEHTKWLSMMYPRLELLRELLSEDGSIWISIDDDESHYLKVLCDEVFGRKNFVASVIWHKKHTRSNDARWFSDNHDFILVYAKDKNSWKINKLPRTDKQDKGYANPDNDSRGVWASGPCHAKTPNPKDIYPITTPSGRVLMPPSGTSWRFSKQNFETLIKDNKIYFGVSGNNVPRYKRFLSEVQDGLVPLTIWFKDEVGDNQEAKKEVKTFNEEDVFTTPKPERLIHRILTLATNPGDWVLDSFLGSGTTSAVAHKMGRRWIGVELGEHAVTHCVPRMKKVIDGEQGGISKDVNWQGGGGFRFYRLGNPVFDESGKIHTAIRFQTLAAHIWFCETKTPPAKSNLRHSGKSPLLGIHNDTAYYLLFNGILGDKRPEGGNVLTGKVLKELPRFSGAKIIYGELTRLGAERLKAEGVIFKQIPYDIKAH